MSRMDDAGSLTAVRPRVPGLRLSDMFAMSLFALRGNILRSVLTALGVIIGIASVIIMLSIGRGARSELDRTISSLGANRIDITPNYARLAGVNIGMESVFSLKDADVVAIRERVPGVRLVSGMLRGNIQTVNADRNWSTQWYGVEQDFFRINDWKLARGQWFTAGDYASAMKVVVIGATVRQRLFGDTNPVGSVIRIGRSPFRVVGELEPKGQSAWGGDQDNAIFVPIQTARRRISGQLDMPPDLLMQISLSVQRVEQMEKVTRRIEQVLRDQHRIGAGAEDDFVVRNLTQLVNTRNQTTQLMSRLLAAVALVSLLVGGIGIMNIMLVSLSERRAEIGLRMAIGATPGQIRLQFLTESMLISFCGGLIGIVCGIAGAYIAGRIGSLPIELAVDIVILAAGFSIATGLFFGYYPASKASQLDPIDALKK
jgi:putative ABC transport system permease protein